MNLAVLVLDYLTYEFEEGALNYYPPCNTCDSDSLPFEVVFRPPGDFGSITFRYTETGDTLLYGSIIWLGTGALAYPGDFLPAGRFGKLPDAAGEPVRKEYFNIYPLLDPAEFEAKADTAWASVNRLDIAWDFAMRDYRAGFYMYAPSVGAFNPSAAKWIVFLYRGKII
jgi:hypothetical protein